MNFRVAVMTCFVFLLGCQTSHKNKQVIENDTKSVVTNNDLVEIDYEKMVLDNGLTVILHQDKSDPIVAFSTIVHVGSSREKKVRTGFAHFFEHMSFNDSENVPMGANRKMIPELGGTRNGGTGVTVPFIMKLYLKTLSKN